MQMRFANESETKKKWPKKRITGGSKIRPGIPSNWEKLELN